MGFEVIAYGKVDQYGVVKMVYQTKFLDEVKNHFIGKNIRFRVDEDILVFSQKLRRYYFGPMLYHLVLAFRDIGEVYTRPELDDKMRRLFLIDEVYDEETGELFIQTKSLSIEANQVSNEMMQEYIRQIRNFAEEYLDYGIPPPTLK